MLIKVFKHRKWFVCSLAVKRCAGTGSPVESSRVYTQQIKREKRKQEQLSDVSNKEKWTARDYQSQGSYYDIGKGFNGDLQKVGYD